MNRTDLFSLLPHPRLSDLLGLLPLKRVQALGFPLTAAQHSQARSGLDARLEAEVQPKVRAALQAPIVAAHKRGLQYPAFCRWLQKQMATRTFTAMADWLTWAERLEIPDTLRGRTREPIALPSPATLHQQLAEFEERARDVARRGDRFQALCTAFPEVDAAFINRWTSRRFSAPQFAKAVLAHVHGRSIKTLERRLAQE